MTRIRTSYAYVFLERMLLHHPNTPGMETSGASGGRDKFKHPSKKKRTRKRKWKPQSGASWADKGKNKLTLQINSLLLPEHGTCFLHFRSQCPLYVQGGPLILLLLVFGVLTGRRLGWKGVSFALLTALSVPLDKSGYILNELF